MADQRFPVGLSSFDDDSSTSPFGKVQYVTDEAAAAQVRSLIWEFAQTPFAEDGDRLSVNEAVRERPRQRQLRDDWDAYVARGYRPPVASLAARCYLSTHDYTRGSGLDFGITMANGKNRAMTAAEAQWVHDNGPRRGIRWTGRDFRPQESWHHNAGYPATVPPIPAEDMEHTIPGVNDMAVFELVRDENKTIWFVRDRVERFPLKPAEVPDYQAFARAHGSSPDVVDQPGKMGSFGRDATVREITYELIKQPSTGSVFLSVNRTILVPLPDGQAVRDMRFYLDKNKGVQLPADADPQEHIASFGAVIGK
jgi:hypothetical protein